MNQAISDPVARGDTQLRGHCQACGRIQAAAGNIAKHGYTVKDRGHGGWFSGVCPGARSLPLELERTVADSIVSMLHDIAIKAHKLACDLQAGVITPETARTGLHVWAADRRLGMVPETVPWASATEYQRADERKRRIHEAEREAEMATRDAAQLTALIERVHGKPLLEVTRPAAPEPILNGEKRRAAADVLTACRVDRGSVVWTKTLPDGHTKRGRMSTRSWRNLPKEA